VKLAIDDVVMIQDSQPHALFGGTVGLGACLAAVLGGRGHRRPYGLEQTAVK